MTRTATDPKPEAEQTPGLSTWLPLAALVLFSVICAPLMLTAGTLGDIHGKRRALRVGIGLFGAGTVIAAVSPHVAVFILGFSIGPAPTG